MRAGRGLGIVCRDLNGSHLCKFHGIAQSRVSPADFSAISQEGYNHLQIFHMHLNGYPCVSASETSFVKNGASTMFRFQLERVRFLSVIQSQWVGSAMTTVTGLLVASPGLHQKWTQEVRIRHWKGQHPWRFGRDPNSSVTGVTRSDRMKGNYVCS